jgi:hypothetical protein
MVTQPLKTERLKQSSISLTEREVLGLPPVLFGHPDSTLTHRVAWAAYRRQAESRCG